VLPAAAGAALALGVSTVLTAAALHVLRTSGVLTALTSAPLWCTAVVALAAEYATQQAFGRGPLARSLPLLSVAEPVVAVTGAALLLGQPLAGGHAGAWLPGALAAAGGVVLLARSPSAEGGGNPAAPDRAAPDRPASGATGRFPPATAAADHPG
jgi:hypothetical protein